MTEGVHAGAIDIGDRAVGAHAQVAGHELDADHGAGFEVGGISHPGWDVSAAGDALPRFQPQRPELRPEGLQGLLAEAAEGDRRGDIHQALVAGHGGAWFGKEVQDIAIAQRRTLRGRAGRRCAHHLLNGANTADGVFGEGKRHGDRAHQPAADIDRAAAHALHDPGMFERPAGEPRQDQGLLGPGVIEHAQDFDLEFVDLVAGKHRPADPAHPRLDVFQREEAGLRGNRGGQREDRRKHKSRHSTIVPVHA